MKVRTRIAPSPTGEFHIGHLRTLLYNIAFCKNKKGKFILRIEDTDRNRFVEGAVEKLLSLLEDFRISYDEGPGKGGPFAPYVQSERLDIYKEHAEQLVREGHAYYCFCTPERLEQLRNEQRSQGMPTTKYDKRCLGLSKRQIEENLAKGLPHTIRLNVPKNENITFNDVVYGDITFESDSIDDQVLLKSDGYPTYQLAVVVDDHLMGITHVMRGNDWLPSTPKHVLLYKAFGWEMPVHIHLPNLKEEGSNKKLSKRFGAVFARQFLEEGYLPEAILNFLMFLGWNPGTEKEIYSLEEFTKDFSLEKIHKTDLVVFDRAKLLWFNGVYIRNLPLAELMQRIETWALRYKVQLISEQATRDEKLKILALVQERMKTLSEYNGLVHFFYETPTLELPKLIKFAKTNERTKEILLGFKKLLSCKETSWDENTLHELCYAFVKENEYKPKEAFMTLRVAVTAETASPPIFDVLEVLGQSESLVRLERAIKLIDSN